MAFRIDPRGSLGSEVSKAATSEIDTAVSDLENRELSLDERVHETRKHIKKLRALLQLVRSQIGATAFAREDGALREVARALGPLRERAALDESLDTLQKGGLEPEVRELCAQIAALVPTALEDKDRFLASSKTSLCLIRGQLQGLTTLGNDWDAIAADFRRTYAGGRKAYRRASVQPSAEHLHALRRRAKRHQHQLGLLEPVWPGPLAARREELGALGDALGEHHDLALLLVRLDGLVTPRALEGARKHLEERIERRSRQLEDSALSLAARLYAERPRHLRARFAEYFRISQGEVTEES